MNPTRLATACLVALAASLLAWATATPTCPRPPIHGDDVACVCLTTVVPARWECWSTE